MTQKNIFKLISNNFFTNLRDEALWQFREYLPVVKELLQAHIDKDLLEGIEWETLKFEVLESQSNALTYSAQVHGEPTLFFLYREHNYKPTTPLSLDYSINQTVLQYAKYRKLKKLPTIITLFYYHGKEKISDAYSLDWDNHTKKFHESFHLITINLANNNECKMYTPDDIWDDCISPELAKRFNKPILIDITQSSDEDIIQNYKRTCYFHLMFKHSFNLPLLEDKEESLEA